MIASLFGVFLLMFAPTVSAALFSPISWEDVRQFEGDRYLSLTRMTIREEPSFSSRVAYDLPPLRLVYGKDISNGWVKVYGVGSRLYPDSFQGLGSAGQIPFDGVNFSSPRIPDRDTYVKISGYVRSNELGPMEKPNELPPIFNASQGLPSLWPGLRDSRRIPHDPTASPFSSVVELSVSFVGTKKTKTMDAFCSGFFIENTSTIASAGHCINGANKLSKQVAELLKEPQVTITYRATVRPGTARAVTIDIQLISWGFDQEVEKSQDWAIFSVKDQVVDGVDPIRLPTYGPWTKSGVVSGVQLGFAGDLKRLKEKTYGSRMVHFDVCKIPLSTISVKSSGLVVSTRGVNCLSGKGDSGGPLIFWNNYSKQYELLGITSWGSAVETINRKAFSPGGLERYLEIRRRLQFSYDLPDDMNEHDSLVPGSTSIMRAAAAAVGVHKISDGWLLDKQFLVALRGKGLKIDPELMLNDFSRESIGLNVERPGDVKLPPLALAAVAMKDFREGNQLRGELMKVAFFPAGRKQLDLTLLDKFDLGEVTRRGLNAKAHHFGQFGGLTLLIDESEVSPYIEQLKTMVSDPKLNQNNKILMEALIRSLPDSLIVQVEGDVFFVHKSSGTIFGVVRNWINEFKGDINATRMHPSFPSEFEKSNRPPTIFKSDVPPTTEIRQKNIGSMTPASIPGGHAIGAREAWRLLATADQTKLPVVLSAISDGNFHLPMALNFSEFAAGADFNDALQSDLARKLKSKNISHRTPIIVYCHSEECWLSYNLALRLIKLGYENVNWMRDGISGWFEMNLPVGRLQ